MKGGFRQSMAWLHGWAGLLAGWVLFFVFLTGTFGYVNAEIDQWMRPEIPTTAALPPATDLLQRAERRLHENAQPDAVFWFVDLPGDRGDTELTIGWKPRPAADDAAGDVHREVLAFGTGMPTNLKPRETGGGATLYAMHYQLHYISHDVAIRIVGACAMVMLVTILSGIVTHRKIFAEFFTFRPGKGQRSWLDGHSLLAVSALPFHLMITWSGLVFYLVAYMPVGLVMLYPQAEVRERALAEAYGSIPATEAGALRNAADLIALGPLLARVQTKLDGARVSRVRIDNPGRENARITIFGETGVGRSGPLLRFDGVTGRQVDDLHGAAPGKFNAILLGLHEGRFAGPALRLLYVLAGLSGTAMIATGLLLWSVKRRARRAGDGTPHLGMCAVDVLNLGTTIGLPVGIAAYFWANRFLPVGMDGRAAWEVHSMFLVWGLSYIFAIWRPVDHAWPELCWVAAGAFGLLPIINALTTDRHLGASIPAGDWVFAGFDLSAFSAGLFFAFVASKAALKVKGQTTAYRSQTEAAA